MSCIGVASAPATQAQNYHCALEICFSEGHEQLISITHWQSVLVSLMMFWSRLALRRSMQNIAPYKRPLTTSAKPSILSV
eukprot:1156818-Pelagomonas_calceolata.AAC.8